MFRARVIPSALVLVITLPSVVSSLVPETSKLRQRDDLRKQLDAIADGFQGKLGYSLL